MFDNSRMLQDVRAKVLRGDISFDLPTGYAFSEGNVSTEPEKRSRIGRIFLLTLKIFIGAHLVFISVIGLFCILYNFINPPVTVLMLYRKVGYGYSIAEPRYVPLSGISRTKRQMLLGLEDWKFYEHHGIDPQAIKRAYETNKRLGYPMYGGSTLSMQLARTLFLVPVKSYARKYLEVIITLELELFMSKERILELYFNYAEWGKGIFGIGAASSYYYKKPVSKLTTDETCRLIALLSSPIKYTVNTINKSNILTQRYNFLISRYN